ncbi:MAG: hypothetical protein ACMXYC_02345 [Candidatus Woesearchaeota archaeon]
MDSEQNIQERYACQASSALGYVLGGAVLGGLGAHDLHSGLEVLVEQHTICATGIQGVVYCGMGILLAYIGTRHTLSKD